MATNLLTRKSSGGQSLDLVFAPYTTGTQLPATGYQVAGVDIASRYAPLYLGSQALPTGLLIASGADLNTLFAAYGSVQTTLPINGVQYQAGGVNVLSNRDVLATCSFGMFSSSTYTITTSGTNTTTQTYPYTPPSNAVFIRLKLALVSGSSQSQVTTGNNSSSWTVIGNNAAYVQRGPTPNTGTQTTQWTLKVEFADATQALIASGTCTFICTTESSL